MNLNEDFKDELEIQKRIAYTAGLLQGDVTIKTLIESLAEGVIIINEKGRIILINNRFAEMTGFNKEDVMGQNMNIFIPNKLHKKHNNHIKDYFREPRIRPMGIGLELETRKKDGTSFPIEISLSFLNTESGKLGIGFITDITSRKKAENELKERNKELDSYAHSVAHDLNSSLTGIIGLSEILTNPDSELQKGESEMYLNDIATRGKQMSSVIRELLLFASMKKEDVEFTNVDMMQLINNAINRLDYQIKESNAIITIQDNILNCNTYGPWIEEVWYNYLSNAIKYGGTPPKIELSCRRTDNGYIEYITKDFGEGIEDEFKNVIFEDTNVTKNKYIKGDGLGLSIVKKILNKLGGNFSVYSEIKNGSSFSFFIKN